MCSCRPWFIQKQLRAVNCLHLLSLVIRPWQRLALLTDRRTWKKKKENETILGPHTSIYWFLYQKEKIEDQQRDINRMQGKSDFPNATKVVCSWPLQPAVTSCSELNGLNLPLLVMVIALNAVLSMIAVPGNVLWIVAYAKTPSLQTPLNMCLLSLASVGLFNGAVMEPLIMSDTAFFLACPSTSCSLEKIVTGIVTLVADSMLQNIAVISIDRYIAIIHSAKYPRWITKTRIFVAFCIYALFRLFLSACVFTGMIDYHSLVISSIVFSIAIIMFTSMRVFVRIHRLGRIVVGAMNADEERRKVQERKITKTVGLIILLSASCYAPAFAYFIAIKSNSVSTILHALIWRFIETVMMLNAVFNFAVYFFRHNDKRVAVRRVITETYNVIKTCGCHWHAKKKKIGKYMYTLIAKWKKW